MKKFCPKCGKEVEELIESLCRDCYLEELRERLPKEIELKVCDDCGMIIKGNDTMLAKPFFKKLVKKLDAKLVSYNDELVIEKDGIEISIPIKRKYKLCHYCSLKKQGYYNAKIQIRFDANYDEIIRWIENRARSARKRDKFAFITKVEYLNNGVDIFIGSKAFAHKIAVELKRKFNVKMKLTKKLITVKLGKRLYRDTIALVKP